MSTVYLDSTRRFFGECGLWARMKLAWKYVWDDQFRAIRKTEVKITSDTMAEHYATMAAQRSKIVELQDQLNELEDEAKWSRLELHMAKKEALTGGTMGKLAFGMGDSTPIPLGHLPYLPGGSSSTHISSVSEYKSPKEAPYPLHVAEETEVPSFREDPP